SPQRFGREIAPHNALRLRTVPPQSRGHGWLARRDPCPHPGLVLPRAFRLHAERLPTQPTTPFRQRIALLLLPAPLRPACDLYGLHREHNAAWRVQRQGPRWCKHHRGWRPRYQEVEQSFASLVPGARLPTVDVVGCEVQVGWTYRSGP